MLKTLWLSLDPYMRGRMSAAKSYAKPVEPGEVMVGGTVSEVVASKHKDYKPGDVVLSYDGWQQYALSKGMGLRKLDPKQAPVQTALGVLGMPGMTAYTGLLTIGQPKPKETVVVAAAAGPVGSVVGQIAKIKGARAVGIAGGKDKCDYIVKELGFDAAIDHRAPDMAAKLKKPARTASTCISRMSAARCGTRCFRCSMISPAFRCAASSRITTTRRFRPGPTARRC